MEKEKYKTHKLANVFPLMNKDSFDELVEDIKKNGLLEPIWLYEGKIIDGRNRYKACKKIKLKPTFRNFKGKGSPLSFIISLNLHRRHLTQSQRAAIALDALPLFKKEAKDRQGKRTDLTSGDKSTEVKRAKPKVKRARDEAGKIFKVSGDYIVAAEKIKEKNKEKFEEIKQGTKTITQANRELKEAKKEKERKKNCRVAKKTKPASFKAKFSTILIDPPWDWGDEGDKDQLGRAKPKYNTIPFKELLKLPLNKLSAKDCHIYLWVTNRSLPKGFKLLKAWGFRYITCITWCKPSFGMGNYFRGSTEQLLFGVKGSLKIKRKDAGTWFVAKRGKEHSQKPIEAYELIESCSHAPYLEMFARNKRKNWKSWGAEV